MLQRGAGRSASDKWRSLRALAAVVSIGGRTQRCLMIPALGERNQWNSDDCVVVPCDRTLDLESRRTGEDDVCCLGLCFSPGGARGWLVGQNSSQARELEPELCG